MADADSNTGASGRMQPLLTAEEVARILVIPLKRLYTWRLAGKGPRYVKVGHNLRYRVEDVKAYIEENTTEPEKTI